MRTMPVAMVGLLAALGAQQPVSEMSVMRWVTDVAAAERAAAKAGKPLLLVFR